MANGSEIECVQYIIFCLSWSTSIWKIRKRKYNCARKKSPWHTSYARWKKNTTKWETKNNHKRFSYAMYEHTMKHVTLEIRLCANLVEKKRKGCVFFSLLSLCSCRSFTAIVILIRIRYRHSMSYWELRNVYLKTIQNHLWFIHWLHALFDIIIKHSSLFAFLIILDESHNERRSQLSSEETYKKHFLWKSEQKNHSHLHSDMEIVIKQSEANCSSWCFYMWFSFHWEGFSLSIESLCIYVIW